MVLKEIGDPAEASWLAGVFETIVIPGVRVARPIRSSDGRWVVSGWSAQRHLAGAFAPRHADIKRVADSVHSALADLAEPRFLRTRDDLHSWADRLSWGEVDDHEGRLGAGHGAGLFGDLAAGRQRVNLPNQVVHGDLFGNVLFAGDAPPAVIDITPYWRPAAWSLAVVAVDALEWGGAPIEVLDDWATGPSWLQLVRRAALFRLAATLADPRTTPEAMVRSLALTERIARLVG